jgi:hypothetical protein
MVRPINCDGATHHEWVDKLTMSGSHRKLDISHYVLEKRGQNEDDRNTYR